MTLTTSSASKSSLPRRLPIIMIAVVALLGALWGSEYLNFETLRAHREALIAFRDTHYGLAVVAFMGVYILIVAFSLPGAAIATLAGGFMFSIVPGVFFNVTAATIGATAVFSAARLGFGDYLAARMEHSEGLARTIKSRIDQNQWSALFLIRLIPAVPFFAANLMPAMVGVPLHRFVISTFLGIMPGGLVYTSVGTGLGEVFARGETPDLTILFAPQIFLPLLGLCVLSALPIVLRIIRAI